MSEIFPDDQEFDREAVDFIRETYQTRGALPAADRSRDGKPIWSRARLARWLPLSRASLRVPDLRSTGYRAEQPDRLPIGDMVDDGAEAEREKLRELFAAHDELETKLLTQLELFEQKKLYADLTDADGKPFESMAAFVSADKPHGLARDPKTLAPNPEPIPAHTDPPLGA